MLALTSVLRAMMASLWDSNTSKVAGGVTKTMATKTRRRLIILRLFMGVVQVSQHYENMPMQYTEIFKFVKNENFL